MDHHDTCEFQKRQPGRCTHPFKRLTAKNVDALITGHDLELGQEALALYATMERDDEALANGFVQELELCSMANSVTHSFWKRRPLEIPVLRNSETRNGRH
eukprot:TRINITY_DN23358_c0_g1_i1.p1 TRINITY_DN23358_c0_g1~~TRINITY_DN23358_c0_g1_i1.p1  ORF type:complete len:101 (-),score=19.50 TRINITY_DN23358_c0_g1_i1:36-338(-)